jgi:hypothetical protein
MFSKVGHQRIAHAATPLSIARTHSPQGPRRPPPADRQAAGGFRGGRGGGALGPTTPPGSRRKRERRAATEPAAAAAKGQRSAGGDDGGYTRGESNACLSHCCRPHSGLFLNPHRPLRMIPTQGRCWVEGDNAAESLDSRSAYGPVRGGLARGGWVGGVGRGWVQCNSRLQTRRPFRQTRAIHLDTPPRQVHLGLLEGRVTHIIWPPRRMGRVAAAPCSERVVPRAGEGEGEGGLL